METKATELLKEISDFCRASGLAESTFGRAAINDGKLVSRLRNGGRITTDTLERLRAFMAKKSENDDSARPLVIARNARRPAGIAMTSADAAPAPDPQRNFRFFDNRQKYLLFVNTCSEKWVIA